MIKIEINNNRTLEMEYFNYWTVVTIRDSDGNVERRYGIEDGEMVMLLNYFQYQKNNGLEIF